MNTIQANTIQTNTIQANTIQVNTIQTNTIQTNTIQTNTIQIINQYICQHCGKNYSSQSSLTYHQKTAKFCLELQNKIIDNREELTCNHCNKEFGSKANLAVHINICKSKKLVEVNDIKEKCRLLEKLVKEKDQLIKEYDQLIKEYDLKLQFEKANCIRLEKENKGLKETKTKVLMSVDL